MSEYDDIINLPHHTSKTHQRMSLYDRAVQFAPFAALTGYGAAVDEAARQTESKASLTPEAKELIDHKLNYILSRPSGSVKVTLTQYVPDGKKSGGAYKEITDAVKQIDPTARTLTLISGKVVSIGDIYRVTIEEQ